MRKSSIEQTDWDEFENDGDILQRLRSFSRYKNSPIKSALTRSSFFLSLLYCRLLGLSKPIFVVLVTNNRCNLNCVYCYGGYGLKNKYEEYSTKQLLKIIDDLKKMGTKLLSLHGGESLLRRDIGEIFNYAKHKGFYISLNTNGYLVSKKINEIRCVDTVCISLDGRKESHDKNRGSGSFEMALKAIDVISGNSIPLVIHATLTKDNIKDMWFLAELAQTKNCRVQYSILYNANDIRDKSLIMSGEEMRMVLKQIIDIKKNGYPVYYSDNVLETAMNWPSDKKHFVLQNNNSDVKGVKFIPCYHGKLKFQIDADGRVITCWAHNIPNAPNIKKIGVEQAIKQCGENNRCKYCAFLANNEHNALMGLGLRNIWNILNIQLADSLKISSNSKKNIFKESTRIG